LDALGQGAAWTPTARVLAKTKKTKDWIKTIFKMGKAQPGAEEKRAKGRERENK